MDILLICNYWHYEFEKKSSRYRTMAEILSCEKNYNVEVITSTFRHQSKKQRDLKYVETIPSAYKVTLLYEPDYKKNVSIRRIYSHHSFAKNVGTYLNNRKKPDMIICSVPSLSVGSAVAKYTRTNKIPLIIDIQDLWPEAFKMAISTPVISDILFFPMMLQANHIYSSADVMMAVSSTYVKRGLSVNGHAVGFPLFIGSDSNLIRQSIQDIWIEKPEDEFWIGYVGALGYSYDIPSVIDAIKLLNDLGYHNIVFKIMGDGVLKERFQAYSKMQKIRCDFLGFLDYGTMMGTLMKCDIAVNPIVGKSVSSIINKVSDYAMAGIPVINTQDSEEYRHILEEYSCGINCDNGNIESIARGIRTLIDNSELRSKMGENSKKLGDELFDRTKTYPKLINVIEKLRS